MSTLFKNQIKRVQCNRYSDWYVPGEKWARSAVTEDVVKSVLDVLHLDIPQPTNDISSLCTIMAMMSPHESLSWIKIPCDYPVFRAGVICKMLSPAVNKEGR